MWVSTERKSLSALVVEVLVIIVVGVELSSTDVCWLIFTSKYLEPNLTVMISVAVCLGIKSQDRIANTED